MPGSAEGYTPFVHADDAAAAVVAALEAPAGVYNVVEDDPLTRGEHAAAWSELVGRPVRLPPAAIARLPVMRTLARSQRVSNRRLRAATEWSPRYTDMRRAWPELVAADAT